MSQETIDDLSRRLADPASRRGILRLLGIGAAKRRGTPDPGHRILFQRGPTRRGFARLGETSRERSRPGRNASAVRVEWAVKNAA